MQSTQTNIKNKTGISKRVVFARFRVQVWLLAVKVLPSREMLTQETVARSHDRSLRGDGETRWEEGQHSAHTTKRFLSD